jgi:hypothetical protein
MKSGTPRQSPDLRTTPDQLSDREQELLPQRVRILEQRLLILKKYDRSTQRLAFHGAERKDTAVSWRRFLLPRSGLERSDFVR